jgi:hypothetical protein
LRAKACWAERQDRASFADVVEDCRSRASHLEDAVRTDRARRAYVSYIFHEIRVPFNGACARLRPLLAILAI